MIEQDKSYIIVTGAAGFIGSCLVGFLNQKGHENLIIVDDFGVEKKRPNWETKKFVAAVERHHLFDWLSTHEPKIEFFLHIGARTDTTEFDYAVHQLLNVDYSKDVWNYCVAFQVPLIYASSAATYGKGELGYTDSHDLPFQLKPLNPYGVSKNEFDKWALLEGTQPPFWAGLKFFNVYGPNEYHKGRMASVIWHSFLQIQEKGFVKLFKSHRPDYKDGQQLRDFIYVKDLLKVIDWLMEQRPNSGLYNLGTGQARSFDDLVKATFSALGKDAVIEYIDMPEDIRDTYQYFTEANMEKIHTAGYSTPFYSLEQGIKDYVQEYLQVLRIY